MITNDSHQSPSSVRCSVECMIVRLTCARNILNICCMSGWNEKVPLCLWALTSSGAASTSCRHRVSEDSVPTLAGKKPGIDGLRDASLDHSPCTSEMEFRYLLSTRIPFDGRQKKCIGGAGIDEASVPQSWRSVRWKPTRAHACSTVVEPKGDLDCYLASQQDQRSLHVAQIPEG